MEWTEQIKGGKEERFFVVEGDFENPVRCRRAWWCVIRGVCYEKGGG
jgi:hypothetical protein